jgi:hypothetical protein
MHKSFLAAATVAVSAMLFGCGNGDDQASSDAGTKGPTLDAQADVSSGGDDVSVEMPAACTNIVKDEDCDQTQRPFVFVHGTYGSGDNFENVASLLASNGFCPDHIVAVEYNSLGDQPGVDCTGPNTPQGCGKIDAAVNAILAKFPQFTQVDLAGHSQGTEWCGDYIGAGGVGAHANKIAHYINFSGIPNVGDVPTLSLSSQHDLADTPHHATGTSVCAFAEEADGGAEAVGPDGGPVAASEAGPSGASDAAVTDATTEGGTAEAGTPPTCNVIQYTFVHQDHFAVAASKGSFIQVYKYLTGKEPQYTDVQCGDDPVTIEGLSETFADNTPALGKIELRKVTTPRADGPPDLTITPDAAGHFLLTTGVSRNVAYEFAGYDSMNNLIGYQYFTPFKRSNRLLRLLSPASMADGSGVGGPIASMTTSKANRSANSTTVIVRWAGGAFRQDLGATLTVDGNNVLTSDNSGANAFMTSNLGGGVVGLFLEDKNNNGKSDLGLVDSAPFIAFTDVFIDAKTPAFVQLGFTAGSEDTDTVNNMAVFSNYPSKPALINVFFQ